MKEFTKDEAMDYYESGEWKNLSYLELAYLQWNNKLLCVPFDKFQEATEKVLGSPVFTHQFATLHDILKSEINRIYMEKTK